MSLAEPPIGREPRDEPEFRTPQNGVPDDFARERGLLERLGKRPLLIFGGGLLGAILGVVLTTRAPVRYQAKTVLLFPQRASAVNIAALLGNLGSGGGYSGPNPLKMTESVLESEAALDIIEKRTGLPRGDIRPARRILPDGVTNTMTIQTTGKTTPEAQELARAHIAALRTLSLRLNLEAISTDEGNLYQEYRRQSARQKIAEERLRKFQETAQTFPTVTVAGTGENSSIVAVPGPFAAKLADADLEIRRLNEQVAEGERRLARTGATAAEIPTDIPSVRTWQESLSRLEYELQRASVTYGPEDAEIVRLTREVEVTKARLQQEIAKAIKAVRSGTVDTQLAQAISARTVAQSQREALARLAAAAPKEALQLQRLTQEVTQLSALVTRLRTQLGFAQLQGRTSTEAFQILDDARVDGPANKSLASGMARYGALGLVGGTVVAFFPLPRRRRRKA